MRSSLSRLLAIALSLVMLATAVPAAAQAGSQDTDGDGVADTIDLDDDGDGLTDATECGAQSCTLVDTDADGRPDNVDLDSDNDGVSDHLESGQNDDANLDGRVDSAFDLDGDGLADSVEAANGPDLGAAPLDQDGDGIPNYRDLDSDGDGIPDFIEARDTSGYVRQLGTTAGVPDPIECAPGFIQIINDTEYGKGQLFISDPITGANLPVGEAAGFSINTISYDPQTELIYGIARQSGIDATGAVVPKLAVVALDLDGEVFLVHKTSPMGIAGAMLGRDLVGTGSASTIVAVDIDTGEGIKKTISPRLSSGLADVIAVGDVLYGMSRGTFMRITDPLGEAIVEEFPGQVQSRSGFGSAFSATDPDTGVISMFFFENATGKIYTVADPMGASPTVSLWGATAKSGSNDGTSCEGAAPPSADIDTDGDGVPDWWDPDLDGDGVGNAGLVAPLDSDGDGVPDFLDTDSDNDTADDASESGIELTGVDADNNGIDDAVEATYEQPDGNINEPLNDLQTERVDSAEVSYREYTEPPPPPEPVVVPRTREVVFVVDGSLSIDALDWSIQLGGIAAALRDAAAFPLDGSVGVGLLQWSDGPEEEVPFTVLDSQQALDEVLGLITSIRQNLGGTSPETGIDAGNGMLSLHGDRRAEQVLCMSTDGKPVNPDRVTNAASLARQSGIDSLAFLAMDDPSRDFDGAAAKEYYGDSVFGSGSLVQARNAVEFASLIVSACLSGDLSVVGLEVNQAVQDWAGSVPLVQDKPTVVRAFVQSLDSVPDRVVARLHGERNGLALPGSPLVPANPGGSALAYQDVRSRRGDLNSSLNFELPASWLSGAVDLRVEMLGGNVACRETIAPTNTCSASISFDEVPNPQVALMRVSHGQDGTTHMATNDERDEQVARMKSALPSADLDVKHRVLFTGDNGAPSLDELNAKLASARAIDGNGHLYLGLVDAAADTITPTETTAGAASWFLDDGGGRNATGYARNQGTKEFARAMGEALASDASGTAWCSSPAEVVSGAPAHPYTQANGDATVAGIGPLGDAETEIWGVDARSFSSDDALAVIDPNSVFSVLSFCNPAGPGDQGQWMDRFHYERLTTSLRTVDWAVGPQSADANGAAGQYSFFRGSINSTGQIVSADLDETFVVDPGTLPETQPVGRYRLSLLDEAGALVQSVDFEPTPINADRPGEAGLFNIPIEGVPEFASAVVSLEGQSLTRQATSDNAPVVTIIMPAEGSSFDGDDLPIIWDGSDADGDDLTYLVQYSTDGGATYETIAIDYVGTELVVPADALAGSDQVRIRVTASDGMLSGSAESAVFSVANTAPLVSITSPLPNQRYDGVQTILLTAEGFDLEDGPIAGDNISWTSSLAGNLGLGGQIVLNAADLDEGFHTITAMVTDSARRAALDQVVIEIRRIAAPPEAPELCQGLIISVDLARGQVPTDGDDVILGTNGTDLIAAGAGNDVICGLGGDDVVWGQGGDDVIFGDGGNDRLRGGPGDDQVFGGDGVDNIAGGSGNDLVLGEAGDDDAVRGGTGDDVVDGGSGNDTIVSGNGGRDQVSGGAGADKVTGGPRPDTVDGGTGDDEVKGNGGADVLMGGAGDDNVLGGPQADTLDGGEGTDSCNGGTTGLGSDGLIALERDTGTACETMTNIEA